MKSLVHTVVRDEGVRRTCIDLLIAIVNALLSERVATTGCETKDGPAIVRPRLTHAHSVAATSD